MDKIVIIHFSLPEMYPPLQNFIRVLEQANPQQKITLLTTAGKYTSLNRFKTSHQNLYIIRMAQSGPGIGKLARMFYYCSFYAGCVWHLLKTKPVTVLYYETLSSFPAYIYKRFINPRASIMLHYHEYTSPQEYQHGMWLTRIFHKYERWLYQHVNWLSHTNAYRMQLFQNDILPLTVEPARIVPNYPPADWYKEIKSIPATPIRILYVGSLSTETMYTKEMAAWVLGQNGKVTWDIYCYNITDEAREFIRSLNSSFIQVHQGLDYSALPDILGDFHIGVILYKGHIPNYVYNAPNKLFEYRTAGLQVWIPDVMTGAMEYVDGINVLSIHFESLHSFNFYDIQLVETENNKGKKYICEDAFKPMVIQLLHGSK